MLSADNLPEEGSLCNLIKPLIEEEKIGAVSSHPNPVNDQNTLFGFVSHLIWDLHYVLSREGNVKLTGEFYAMRPLIKEIPLVINDDLYIESKIKEQGYEIEQASGAISYMKGPETLRDFMIQRIRVHIGHRQITRMTGYVPQTVRASKVLREMMKIADLKKMHFLIGAIFFEMCARILALFLLHRKKIPYKWDHAKTTKKF